MAVHVRDPLLAGDGLPIQLVSRLLGVPASTLRSWERRYGLPVTVRSVGGHRRYSDADVHEMRLMRNEIGRGHRAADAARSVRQLLDHNDSSSSRVDRLLAASEAMDPAGVREVLDLSCEELGLGATLDRVMLPALRQIGAWWESGRCDIAQEHVTSDAVRGWLARVTSYAPRPVAAGPVLLACGPDDLHTMGLEALACLLAEHERACLVLGARTPRVALVKAVARTDASAVVVVSHLVTHRRTTVEALVAAAATGCPTFYAGNAFLFAGARVSVPGTYLGESLTAAAEQILVSQADLMGP